MTDDRILPFAYTLSDRSDTTLARIRAHAARTVGRLPQILGKPGHSTVSVWPMPEGVHLFDIKGPARSFVQAAGTAEAMTIEWGHFDDNGDWHVWTLGHGGPRSGEPHVEISFYDGKHQKLVYPDEVFDAAEAAEIFIHYLDGEAVPDHYVLREHDLAPSEPS